MSQENVEAFTRGLEAGNRGDVETLLGVLDPEVAWHSALHALLGGEATAYRGHDGVREMLQDLYEASARSTSRSRRSGIWETDSSRSAAPARMARQAGLTSSRLSGS